MKTINRITCIAPKAISLLLLIASVGVVGCDGDLPETSKIDKLRTLAIVAEPPQVNPGETTTISTLTVVPDDQVISYHWYLCLVPESSSGFFGGNSGSNSGSNASLDSGYTCRDAVDDGLDQAYDLGTDPEFTYTVPADILEDSNILNTYYGLPETFELPAPLDEIFIEVAGINLTVTLVATTVDGGEVISSKRINVSSTPTLENNTVSANPLDLAFTLTLSDDLPIDPQLQPPENKGCFVGQPKPTLIPDTNYFMRPSNIPTPHVPYLVLLTSVGNTDTPFEILETQEDWFISYYSDKGSFTTDRGKTATEAPAGEWHLGEDDTGEANIWIVVRNGRGGTNWCHDTLTIR